MVNQSVEAHREPNSGSSTLMTIMETCLGKMRDWERVLLLLRSQNMPYTEIARYVHKPA